MRAIPLLICLLSLLVCGAARADVVKPALIEISTYTNGYVEVELRASIEALLTGINSQYKNTQDAPTAADYDVLRALQADELRQAFVPFEAEMLNELWLKVDGEKIRLAVGEVEIPEPGYTKVPRISVIKLTAEIDTSARSLQWYYPARFGDNAVRVRQVDTDNEKWHWSEWQWLRNDDASEQFSLTEIFTARPIYEVIFSYMVVGFEHILPKGLDHILFILGLFLLSTRMRPLLWQVTMFTLAHTITLGLSMNGVINLPPNVVEPLIALSIAYVGIENVFAHSLHKSRLFLVFGFGLLHGLGFAGVLSDFGMPSNAFATALISFNVGVELGQLAVLSLAFLAVGLWFRNTSWYRSGIIIPGSLMIALTGLYWTLERLELF
jgi:hydrogenase/urease accessory protein HupE